MVAAALAVPSLASLRTALAQPTAEQLKTADFLFVQTARGMTFDKTANTVTLGGVSPVTVFFSDRPERIAGNMKTAAFIPLWAKGKDSFKSDPPNADISLLEGDKLTQIVAELQDPVLNGEDLTYTVKILKGDMPTRGGEVSVFIDIFGRPLTPISFAGIARRRFRRAFLY
ncbi:hypothetical protein [Methylobacterium sp. WSM2598]|uniref:hypothetical protein n=1 Tax=Methylobacterium sp. WSM2598 TaxID=398261 RepID=UPI0003757C83|nr:hypothetical protein [Methylobacterium sp. WSM2598]